MSEPKAPVAPPNFNDRLLALENAVEAYQDLLDRRLAVIESNIELLRLATPDHEGISIGLAERLSRYEKNLADTSRDIIGLRRAFNTHLQSTHGIAPASNNPTQRRG